MFSRGGANLPDTAAASTDRETEGRLRFALSVGLIWLVAVNVVYYAGLFNRVWNELGGVVNRTGRVVGG